MVIFVPVIQHCHRMKRLLLTILLSASMLATAAEAVAQRIAYGERTPKIKLKKCKWLDDAVPQDGDFLYIGFIYSRSDTCIELCERIKRQAEQMTQKPCVILVTCECEEEIEGHLREYLGPQTGIILDSSGRIFRDFGIRYVPFGVLTDAKRRALWFGNPLTADRNLFRNMSQSNK